MPAEFLTPLIMAPVDNGRRWQLRYPLVFRSEVLGRVLEVPAGFVCDLNSMPRLAWIVSPKTDFPEAGALHDWGYAGNLSRADADKVYREALEVLGMGRARRGFRYLALRVFGRWAYRDAEDR